MARFARLHAPGNVFHVIARFVNREFRLTCDEQRELYLSGVPAALRQSDWRPLAFALMSNHIHWLLYAGNAPLWRFIKPLHIRFATLSNRSAGRLGPVFAGRPSSILVRGNFSRVIAYVHNNPVRARLVGDPAASSWTSHRAYVGEVEPPKWLDMALGLRLSGLNMSDGHLFHQMVISHADDGRSALLEGEGLAGVRRRIRAKLNASVELTSPQIELCEGRAITALNAPSVTFFRRPDIDLQSLLARVAQFTGVRAGEVASGSRRRALTFSRRLFLGAATALGYTLTEAGSAIGLSVTGASMLLSRTRDCQAFAQAVSSVLPIPKMSGAG